MNGCVARKSVDLQDTGQRLWLGSSGRSNLLGWGWGHCEALLLRNEGLGSQDPALQLTSDGIFSAEWPSPHPYIRFLWGSNGTIQFISISFDLMETACFLLRA